MLSLDVFRARAFRLALAFCLAVSAATAAAFGLIYLEVSRADVQRSAAVLVDEAAKSEDDSEDRLRRALELRLTRDIRRLDYVALFDAKGAKLFGDVPAMPAIPIDGEAHVVAEQLLPDASRSEPAIFVARRRADGGVVLFGRSLREAYDLQETVLRALAIALSRRTPGPNRCAPQCRAPSPRSTRRPSPSLRSCASPPSKTAPGRNGSRTSTSGRSAPRWSSSINRSRSRSSSR